MGDTILIETTADEVVSIVTAGPQGPSGAEAATLTTTGDLLYRAALANDRLGIGSEGQVLKVASGLPVWANESGAVTSVNGETGAVTLDAADVGAQSILVNQGVTWTSSQTLSAARAIRYSALVNGDVGITLPTSGHQVGDVVVIFRAPAGSGTLTVQRGNPVAGSWTVESGQQFRWLASGSGANDWDIVSVDTHTHAAADITSGTLDIARLPTGTGSTQVAFGNHTHGNLTNDGKVGSTAGLPLKTGTAGVVEAGAFGGGAGEFAEGNHTHAQLHDKSHTMTDATSHTAGNHKVFYSDGTGSIVELALGNSGEVLTSNGATSAPSFAAASAGDTVSIDTTAADVLTATSGAISADDGGTIDSADPFIKWDDTAGKLVYANPLSRPSGAFYVGLAPTTTALGTDAVNVQSARSAATRVASGSNAVNIGSQSTASGTNSVAIGSLVNQATGTQSVAIGYARAINTYAVAIGASNVTASASASAAFGFCGNDGGATATNATAINTQGFSADLRGSFFTLPFRSVYWGGQTTNDTATVLNLDATATNRFTIAANTALAVDILLVARRSDTADKWLVARRFLGIRRDGSNNTSLIGSVQTLGTDQSDGSPTWSFTLTADDTNEALQLEVTGAASETVQWRATAFYRVV